MTRQVAIGAIVAFALTVLGLSLWQPGSASPATTPPPAGASAPLVGTEPRELRLGPQPVELRQTTNIGPRLLKNLALEAPADAGTAPAP